MDIIYTQGQKGKTPMWYGRAKRSLQHRGQRLQEAMEAFGWQAVSGEKGRLQVLWKGMQEMVHRPLQN